QRLMAAPSRGFARAYVDASLMPSAAPDWMIPATFTAEMFASLGAALCRPSVGILTDLLLAGVRPFMFYERQNLEMRDNAASLARANLGTLASDAAEAISLAMNQSGDQQAREAFAQRCRTIDGDGAEQAAAILLRR